MRTRLPLWTLPQTERAETVCAAHAFEQYAMCLAVQGRRPEIVALLEHANGYREPILRYALAACFARDRNWEAALAELRLILKAHPGHVAVRDLAMRVLFQVAETHLSSETWEALADVIADALALSGTSELDGFKRFRTVLPVCHVRGGRREDAARLWREALCNDSDNLHALHGLAVLHYWWARDSERLNGRVPEQVPRQGLATSATGGPPPLSFGRPQTHIPEVSRIDKQDLIRLARIGAKHILDMTESADDRKAWDERMLADVCDVVDWMAGKINQPRRAVLDAVYGYAVRVAARFGAPAVTGENGRQARQCQPGAASLAVAQAADGLPSGQRESAARGVVSALWEKAIAYWTVLAGHDAFWQQWGTGRSSSITPLDDVELQRLRSDVLDRQIAGHFQSRASECKERQSDLDALTYDELYTTALAEKKSSEQWRVAADFLDLGCELRFGGVTQLLLLPGGCLFFREFGLLDDIAAYASELAKIGEYQLALQLKLHFSPVGLGRISVLIEDRLNPERALALLGGLPKDARDLPEARYLLIQAIAETAALLANRHEINRALEEWGKATFAGEDLLRTVSKTNLFHGPVNDLLETIGATVESAVQKEAAHLRDGHLDDAIDLLELSYYQYPRAGLRDYLCIFYCHRGSRQNQAECWAEARTDFSKALKVNSEHQPAKAGLATAYNNEAIATKDPTKALHLAEFAVQYDLGNDRLKENLAWALNARAIEFLNGVGRFSGTKPFEEAIQFLRRAIALACPSLRSSAIDGPVREGAGGRLDRMVSGLPEDEIKAILLRNVANAADARRRYKAGSLNSKAVDILDRMASTAKYTECDRAIVLLRRAAKILNPRLDDALLLDAIDANGLLQFQGDVDDELYRLVIKHLAIAEQRKTQLRGY